jgi:hypothetical protein
VLGQEIPIYFGSAQNDYRIALDKESHFFKETTVTVPHSQKFPLLMGLELDVFGQDVTPCYS